MLVLCCFSTEQKYKKRGLDEWIIFILDKRKEK